MKPVSTCFSLLCMLFIVGLAPAAQATTMIIMNGDAANEGFNDTTPFTATGGNNATTLGQARLNAMQFAADIWGALLDSPVPVEILATMDPLGGSNTGATLGQASPTLAMDSFPGAPLVNTLYPVALANALAGFDNIPAGNPQGAPSQDIDARFNSDVDGNIVLGGVHWYYGLDGNPPLNPQTGVQDEDFVTTVLHELGHGLGFSDGYIIDVINQTVAKTAQIDSAFGRFVEHHGATPALFPDMTDTQRYAATVSGALHFIGAYTVAALGRHAELYAPASVSSGSSISHFDEGVLPNELMSPFGSGPQHQVGLALQVMQDIGWPLSIVAAPTISGPGSMAVNRATVFSISSINGAGAYDWEFTDRSTTVAVEGGESGLTPWLSSVSSGYSVIDNQTAASGTNSLHLAMPVAADQVITLQRTFRLGSTSQLTFQSSLNCAASGQTARLQLSADDGRSWGDVWSQQGNQTQCFQTISPFALQSVSLNSFAGKRVQLRLLYDYANRGTFFSFTDVTAGWHVDDITMINAEEYINPVISTVTANSFSTTPTALGNITLRARAQVGGLTTPWGAEKDVTVSATGPVINLDVDASGLSDASDGVMILRRLNGAGTVTTGIVLPAGSNNTTVLNAISNAGTGFDVDGDGDADANDGVMILRRLNGAGTVTTGIVLPNGVGGADPGGSRSNTEIFGVIDSLK